VSAPLRWFQTRCFVPIAHALSLCRLRRMGAMGGPSSVSDRAARGPVVRKANRPKRHRPDSKGLTGAVSALQSAFRRRMDNPVTPSFSMRCRMGRMKAGKPGRALFLCDAGRLSPGLPHPALRTGHPTNNDPRRGGNDRRRVQRKHRNGRQVARRCRPGSGGGPRSGRMPGLRPGAPEVSVTWQQPSKRSLMDASAPIH
jgi:hypothetical protein